MLAYVTTLTTLMMKTYEKNNAVKNDVIPEHRLEVSGS